jgi:D-glycerate 3-kinase
MVPSFDKSRFNGEGDRVPIDQWERVTGNPPIDVVIFEGWSVGFQWLDGPELEKKWRRAKEANVSDDENERKGFSINTLRNHPIAHLRVINENLRRYNKTFMNPDSFNYLVHLDTNNLANVYYWRMDQEHALKKVKGTGMTDDMVVQFVQGYMPAYELYLEKLQKEPFIPKTGQEDTQLRVVLNSDRKVISISTL